MTEEGIWQSLAGIILFAVSAFIIIALVGKSLLGIQGSFEASICKFNAWMRASTIGSPLFQIVASSSQFLTGGYGRQISSSVTMPLVCSPAPELPEKSGNKPFRIDEIVTKIVDESVNCWDQFGAGKWDPLVMSEQGQAFTCYEQVLTINCTRNSLRNLWNETTAEVDTIVGTGQFGQAALNYYTKTHSYSYYGFSKTYADIIGQGKLIIGSAWDGYFDCNGEAQSYFVSVNFVDAFSGGLSGLVSVPLVCETVSMTNVRSDNLYICIGKYGGLLQ